MARICCVCALFLPVSAVALDTDGGMRPIDACGVLVQGHGCVLFEGGGGSYVIPDAGNFRFGDAVRVVGTLDPNCITICPDADGCVRGAVLYDPLVFPCGTPLPSFPGDLLTGLCETLGGVLVALPLVGLWYTRSRGPRSASPC